MLIQVLRDDYESGPKTIGITALSPQMDGLHYVGDARPDLLPDLQFTQWRRQPSMLIQVGRVRTMNLCW